MKNIIIAVNIYLALGTATTIQPTLSLNSIEKQLSVLEKEKVEFEKQDKTQEIAIRLEEQKALKSKVEAATGKIRAFLSKKLSLATQDHQVLSEIEQVRQHYIMLIQEHIKLLQEYKTDPEFEKFKLQPKTAYSFDEFEDLGRSLLRTRSRLSDIEKSQAGLYDDLNKRKKAYSVLEDELKSTIKQQEDLSHNGPNSSEGLTRSQSAELLDLQKRLLEDKKVLAHVKVKEAEQQINLFDTQSMVLREQLAILKSHYEHVKEALYVDLSYLRKSEAELDRKRNEAAVESERIRNDIKSLITLKDELHRKVTESAQSFKLNANDLSAIRSLSKTPTNASEWRILCSIGHQALEETVLDLEREYKEALIELEKAKIRKEDIQHAIIRSWHSLTHKRLGFDSYTLSQQIKSYETPKAEIQGDLALLTEKRMRALASLQDLNGALERTKQLANNLKDKREDFRDPESTQYSVCNQQMRDLEEQIHRKLYLTAKLIEVYSTAIATLEDTTKRIEHMITQLGTKNFWSRSDESITWAELKNVIPDIRRFFDDVAIGLSNAWRTTTLTSLVGSIGTKLPGPTTLILLLLRILILFLIFWVLRMYLPELRAYLEKKPGYFVHSNSRLLLASIISFISNHLVGIYLWFLLYFLISFEFITNAYIAVIFYLLSIPYMLYIAHSFLTYFIQTNDKLGSIFISASYRARFMRVLPILLYATIVLFFFRKAFMVGSYHTSAVPTVLLAINYIILQLSLMSLISKEWILASIPRTTPLWEWVSDFIGRYYYVFWTIIVSLIIMSYPYIGYGKQVLYILFRIFLIGLLLSALSYVYGRMRRVSADLFFYSAEGETIKERFPSSRAWYGFFIVVSFCIFAMLGAILIATVIGYPITLSDILNWLNYELYSRFDEMGRKLSITPVTFLKFIIIFIAGLVAAYVINRILLRKIFDPLLISSGVQNVIFTLTRYFIIFIALLIGMKSVGLESFATRLVLVLGALGFAVKDPILDFFSYFIILVQRPIKIGDLIMIDSETRGIVRHITPRSVILRRDNSVTLVVPNSAFITRPVINWTYSPTFFGLNDIFFIIPYTFDPERVKSLIAHVIEKNPNILKNPPPVIRVDSFVENGYQFIVRGYVTAEKVLEQWEIASNLRIDLLKAFKAEKIEFAVPVRNVKVIESKEEIHKQE